MSLGRLLPALACLGLALPAGAAAGVLDVTDPFDPPAAYCDGAVDAGLAGQLSTDREHERLSPPAPLPTGLRERPLTAAGVTTTVVEAGSAADAEAVVFVHGNPGSSRDWVGLLAATARIGRGVALDLPGFGRASDGARGDYSVTGAARFLDAALSALGVRRAHLVLHDFGGPFGLEWAAAHTDRLASVTLINTGVLIGYLGHTAAHTWRTPIVGEVAMAALTRPLFHGFLQGQEPERLPEDFVDRMYDDFDRATRCAVLRYYRDVDDPGALGRRQAAALRPHDIPALVIWGSRDPYLPAALAERQREAFPSATVHVLEGAGHWPFVTRRDVTEGLVTEFLLGRLSG